MNRRGLHNTIIAVASVCALLSGLADYRLLPYLLAGVVSLFLVLKLPAAVSGRKWSSLRVNPKFALLFGSIFISLAAAEALLQIFFFNHIPRLSTASYKTVYNSTLGWFPVPNYHTPDGEAPLFNNSMGFRGNEFHRTGKAGLMFSGDSFVWGYNIENLNDRFTDRIQAKHPEWNVYNVGITGYGTDQELILQQQILDRLNPQVVFLLFCTENDHIDNSGNMSYGAHKPYYTTNELGLQLHGVPVPRSELSFCSEHLVLSHSYLFRLFVRAWKRITTPPFATHPDPTLPLILEMNKYVRSKGAILAVGLTAPDPAVEHLLQGAEIPWVNLHLDIEYCFANDPSRHWTAEGNGLAAAKIEEFLKTNTVVSPILHK